MGYVGIIARRLEGSTRVQYGWCGAGSHFQVVGNRLLLWYNDPDMVEYLFGLGQMRRIGKPGSERGGEIWFYTNEPDDRPHWLGKSEREIFSQYVFIDRGYFYDLDETWYYVIPGPFRIKIPLLYMGEHLDEEGEEDDECDRIEQRLVEYILGDYYAKEPLLQSIVAEKYPQGIEAVREDVLSERTIEEGPCERLWGKYKDIFHFFDDWVVVNTSDDLKDITCFLLRRKQKRAHIETIDWK